MKKLFKIFLILLFFITCQMSGNAYTVQEQELSQAIIKAIKTDLSRFNLTKSEVKIIHLTYNQVEIPNGLKYKVQVTTNANFPGAKMYYKTDVFAGDKIYLSMGVPVAISAYKDVVMTTQEIKRGSLITPNMVQVKNLDVSNLILKDTLTMDDVKKEIIATKQYRANEALDKRFVQANPDVRQNSQVKAIFQSSKHIEIAMDGIALADGYKGDMISIKTDFKKVYSGKVIGTNKVLIKI